MSKAYNFKLEGEANPQIWLKENFCPECGKIFFPTPGVWAWRKGKNGPLVCSYGCSRKGSKKTTVGCDDPSSGK